jgi:hypothetical protein
MTSYQEGFEKMSLASSIFLNANATITSTLPNYAGYFSIIQSTNTQIQAVHVKQEADKSGDTNAKKQLRATLIAQAIDVSRRVVAFATNANNSALLALVDYTESDLKKASDQKLVSICQVIYENANTNVAALASYGVVAKTLSTLQTSITSFNSSIPKGRVDTTDSGDATQQLTTLFKTLTTNWAKIDTLVEMVRTSQPNFYNEYQKVRKVIETGTGSLAVKGLVTDAMTGEPIKNATLSFSLEGNNITAKVAKAATDSVIKKTAEKGGFNIKSLPSGMYTVTIKKVGYADQVATVAVADGELTDLNIQLSKN